MYLLTHLIYWNFYLLKSVIYGSKQLQRMKSYDFSNSKTSQILNSVIRSLVQEWNENMNSMLVF